MSKRYIYFLRQHNEDKALVFKIIILNIISFQSIITVNYYIYIAVNCQSHC